MLSDLYNKFKGAILSDLDLSANTIKVALFTASYSPNIDTHVYFGDLTNEVSSSGTGYPAGGVALASKTITIDNTNDKAAFDAADVVFTSLSATFQTAVMYKDTGNPATSPLIGYWNNETPIVASGQNLRLTFNASGIIMLSSAGFGF